MKRNKKVIEFLSKTYSTIIKQRLSFGYSIQATMNRIIKSKSIIGLNVHGISDSIFVDGNTMLNRITYYDDIKQYNYLGFHYDFIVGIKAKTFRIKELNLYDIDDNGYYSSSKNKYIMLETDIQEDYIYNLNHFLCIANRTNRIAILPKIINKNKNPKYKSYVRLINIGILEKRFGKNYRVPSFLDNKNIPLYLKDNKKKISHSHITLDSLLSKNEQLICINKFF